MPALSAQDGGLLMPTVEDVFGPGGERLATVLRLGGPMAGLHFLSRPDDLLQVGAMFHRAGHAVPVHVHNPVPRLTEGTAEVLVVLEGMVRVDVYVVGRGADPPCKVRRVRLGPLDAVVFHPGSVHGLVVLHDARVVEVKSGPYHGRDADKTDGQEVPHGATGEGPDGPPQERGPAAGVQDPAG